MRITSDLDPSTVGHPPFDEPALHRQVVGGTAEQTPVPSVRSFEVGHRYYGEDMIDGHRLLPLFLLTRRRSQSLRLIGRRSSHHGTAGHDRTSGQMTQLPR